MPNTSSAKKAFRQSEKNRLANKSATNKIKTSKKKFLALILAKNFEGAKEAFKETQSLMAKAAKTGLFHRNKSARLTSRMANKFPKP